MLPVGPVKSHLAGTCAGAYLLPAICPSPPSLEIPRCLAHHRPREGTGKQAGACRRRKGLPPRGVEMNLIVVTPVRLLGDGLAACFAVREGVSVVATLPDLARLREALRAPEEIEIVLVDVTHGVDLDDMRAIALEQPTLTFVALGLL